MLELRGFFLPLAESPSLLVVLGGSLTREWAEHRDGQASIDLVGSCAHGEGYLLAALSAVDAPLGQVRLAGPGARLEGSVLVGRRMRSWLRLHGGGFARSGPGGAAEILPLVGMRAGPGAWIFDVLAPAYLGSRWMVQESTHLLAGVEWTRRFREDPSTGEIRPATFPTGTLGLDQRLAGGVWSTVRLLGSGEGGLWLLLDISWRI